ncbi:MAG: hypothetical protein A2746_01280 [Candidatus Yanofskybacteria bacterium RIFCSPHIGHO2_01_FULL_44_22]|uniref:EfeO-type cupredoxin-like domain-containing protein n=1 Tax=Candidatus Yanofskybacteria bacterium RIFCSPHIGHO2_01_FULL_44_22 TaxID=1802669 RepID=A0A1F8EY45_9BACT|nr:MAG: hypothetical protein A2746_01280 [Candidatus Yanofskybacteria bacterium RIFCSPHIGHO2_01_FULL_44_22]
MESYPQQPQAELTARREKKIPTLSGPGIFWVFIIIVLVLTAVAINLLGNPGGGDGLASIPPSIDETPGETRQPRLYTVSYRAGVFSPTNLKIHSGDTVRFKNDGLLSIRVVSDPHPEHNNLVGFDSIGDIPQGSYFSFTFAAKGIFGYHNEKNINEAGTIIIR